jgi:hypothetical protein
MGVGAATRAQRLSDRVGSAKARLSQASVSLAVWMPVHRKKDALHQTIAPIPTAN